MTRNILKTGFSALAAILMMTLVACNSGSKTDQVSTTDSVTTATADSATTAAPAPAKDSATTATPTPATAATSTASTETTDNAKATTHTVTIDNMKFTPATLTIKKGDKVTFINKDIVGHNATAKDNSWGSKTLNTGDSWTVTPTKTVDYSCTIHPTMTGKIEVK